MSCEMSTLLMLPILSSVLSEIGSPFLARAKNTFISCSVSEYLGCEGRGCPSLVGGSSVGESRPAKPVVLWAARVQIPHPAPKLFCARTINALKLKRGFLKNCGERVELSFSA